MLCPLCGKNTAHKRNKYNHQVQLMEPFVSFTVEVKAITCDSCNESFLDDKACRQIEKAINDKYPNYFKKRTK